MMARRVLCLVLIPLVQAGQGWCFAHVHCPELATPSDHGRRPHFHVHGGRGTDRHFGGEQCIGRAGAHRHTHRHEDPCPAGPGTCGPVGQIGDHEADAVYCPDVPTLARGGNFWPEAADLDVAASVPDTAPALPAGWRPVMGEDLPPPFPAPRCPLYLRMLALRC